MNNNFIGSEPTEFVPDIPSVNVESGIETFNNRITTTKQALIDWVLTMLGYPLLSVELAPSQLDVCISNACHTYTKYATFSEKYITVDFSMYNDATGLNVKKFNISQVKDMSFVSPLHLGVNTSSLCFGMAGAISQQASWRNFSFVSLQMLHEYKELAERMLFPKPDWTYNNVTGNLLLYPSPWTMLQRHGNQYMFKGAQYSYCSAINNSDSTQCMTCNDKDQCHNGYKCGFIPAVLTVEIEPTLEELYSNDIVKQMTFGYCQMLLGTIRSKFSNIALPGGGNVNGEELRRSGQELVDKAISLARADSFGNMFVIA